MSQVGILLIGHGTRNAAGTDCVVRLRNLVAERAPDLLVRHSFLELNAQTIQSGVDELLEMGVSKIAAVPLLLFSAGHAKTDIPRACAAAAAGRAEIRQAEPFGCDPQLVELSRLRYEEALRSLPRVDPKETCPLLVGRGSYDSEATAEMHNFAAARQKSLPGVRVEVAFIAMASPAVQQVVERLASSAIRRIVIQPHLLFPGDLLDQLRELVGRQNRQNAGADWLLAPPLAGDLGRGGPADQLLTDAVIERARTALHRF